MKKLVFGVMVLVGCDSGSSDGDDGGLGAGGGAGGAGGGAGESCAVPAGATVLLDYTDLRVNASDVTDGSVVRGIAVEADGLYVATLNQVVRLAGPSDSPNRVYLGVGTLGLSFWDVDDGFLIRDETGWRDETGAAVSYPDFEQPTAGLNAPATSLVAPNGDLYARFDDLDMNFDPAVVHYVRAVAGAGAQEVLATNAPAEQGFGRSLFFGGGALWTTTAAERFGDPPIPPQPVRIGPDGALSTLSVDKPGPIFLVTDTFIYYDRDPQAPLEELGVWRAPVGGGAGEKLGGTFGGWSGVADGGRVLLANASTLAVIDDVPGATLTEVAQLPVRSTLDTSCTRHGLAFKDGRIYSSMFDQAREMSLVFSYDAP